TLPEWGASSPSRGAHRGEEIVVHVAVSPVLPDLARRDHRMLGRAIVSGGMPMRRLVAAPHVAALKAHPEVHPAPADAQAFLASCGWTMHRTGQLWRDVLAGVRAIDGSVVGHAIHCAAA